MMRPELVCRSLAVRPVILTAVLLSVLCRPLVGRAEETASLTVRSAPAGASVYLDGRWVGLTPCTVADVGQGAHLLRLTRYGLVELRQPVEVSSQQGTVSVTLRQVGQSALRFEVNPKQTRVYVDGQLRGESPLTLTNVTPGKHEVRLEADWFLPWQGTVEVVEGRETVVVQTLESKTESYLVAALERDPERVVNYYELGHLYARQQRFEEAFAAFGKGFDACTAPNLSTNEMRRLYDEFERIWDGQYEFTDDTTRKSLRSQQIEALRAAIERRPRNVLNYYLLAQFHRNLGDYEAALDVLEQGYGAVRSERCKRYLEQYLGYYTYYQVLALKKAKQYDELLAVTEKLVTAHPNAYYARHCLTQAAVTWQTYKKDYAKALEARQQFLKLYPDSDMCPTVLAGIASLYRSYLKDFAKAAETYRTYVRRYPDEPRAATYLLTLASLQRIQLKNPKAATATYEEFLKRYPRHDSGAIALRMLYTLYQAEGNEEQAAAARKRLLRDFPRSTYAAALDDDPKHKATRAQAAKAYAAAAKLAQHDKQAAAKAYAEVVTQYPATSFAQSAQTSLIELCNAQKDYEGEIRERRRFLELFPDDDGAGEMQYQIGYVLCHKLGRIEEGVAALRKVRERYPESSYCLAAQGEIADAYAIRGAHYDREKCLAENQRLIDLFPNYDSLPTIQINLALNFYYQFLPGDLERGRAELRKVLERYPWSYYTTKAEYYLDMLDDGMQLEENALLRNDLSKTGR